jgi:hypothetical protein
MQASIAPHMMTRAHSYSRVVQDYNKTRSRRHNTVSHVPTLSRTTPTPASLMAYITPPSRPHCPRTYTLTHTLMKHTSNTPTVYHNIRLSHLPLYASCHTSQAPSSTTDHVPHPLACACIHTCIHMQHTHVLANSNMHSIHTHVIRNLQNTHTHAHTHTHTYTHMHSCWSSTQHAHD